MRVAVVGAGLSGLVASIELSRDGHDVVVYDENEEVGGRVRTTYRDGYVLDHGFQVLFTAYPETRRYLDYGALDLRGFDPGAVVASEDGVSVLADPLRSPRDAPAALMSGDATLLDKLRVLRLRRRLSGKDREDCFATDETGMSTREYLRDRGFSDLFVRRFAEPFYGGITLDRSLGTSAAVFEFTFSMLSTGRTVVPNGGMAEVPRRLASGAREAGVSFETGVRVEALNGTEIEAEDGDADHDAVVVATDPREAERLTGVDTPDGHKGCVTQYYETDAPLDVGAKIVLNADRRDGEPNQVVPMSAAAPGYSPEGSTLLSATFLGDDDREDRELADATRSALDRWNDTRFDVPLETVGTTRVPFAQSAQPPGFTRSLPEQTAPDGDVVLAGDYTHDSSINGAMLSGRRAAEILSG